MRWSCPHCGINLAIAEEKVGSGWSFSRCYKCGGFALIRRSEVNIIKVDKAPPGEKVLLPEASDDVSQAMMNEGASQKLAQHMVGTGKPVIRPANSNNNNNGNGAANNIANNILNNSNRNIAVTAATQNQLSDYLTQPLPPPLPETPTRQSLAKHLPSAMIATAIIAIGSGFYLYLQGEELWQRTRSSVVAENKSRAPAEEIVAERAVSKAMDTVEVTAPRVAQQQQQAQATSPIPLPVMDQVHHSAAEAEAVPSSGATALYVQVRSANANFHTGPGMQYPIISGADRRVRYTVADWSDRWFKVLIPGSNGYGESNIPPATGWIRNDLVQLVRVSEP